VSTAVQCDHLTRVFRVFTKEPGMAASLKGLVTRKSTEVRAVDDISFDIQAGEIVGIIGENGAGKTTTLKLISGLLLPTAGKVRVLGHDPFEKKQAFLKRISFVMSQKDRLDWDLPPYDSFLLLKEIYRIPTGQFRRNVEELSSLLNVGSKLTSPVRRLSFGERMKCELVAAFLHSPELVLLDEPTVGLDVLSQKAIRGFLQNWRVSDNRPTIIVTSHNMKDIEALCSRVILLRKGRILWDGAIEGLLDYLGRDRKVLVRSSSPQVPREISHIPHTVDAAGTYTFTVNRAELSSVVAAMLNSGWAKDLVVQQPDLEDIVYSIYSEGVQG